MTTYQDSVKSRALNLRSEGFKIVFDYTTGTNTYDIKIQYKDMLGNDIQQNMPFLAYVALTSTLTTPVSMSGGATDQSAKLSVVTGFLTFDDQADKSQAYFLTNTTGFAQIRISYDQTKNFYMNVIDCDGIFNQTKELVFA